MSNPVDPTRAAAAHDPHSSAASDRDETAPASPPPPTGAPDAPRFGPPAAAGEVGVLGPYRVLKQLGAGGMGAVYLALDTRLDRKLALKVMLPAFAADADAKERFLREARAAAKISHDNVVTVFEADERDGVPYIAMQLLQGYPLDEYLKTKGAPPLPHVIRIARETALGLAAAHALGLVHRDIKTANLWLEAPNGRVKVLDFGLAKPVGSDAELTKSGAVVGTPAYMSPEQARGSKVDARTDLFSLGAVLYRLCTGQNPFRGEHVMAVLAALITDDPTPVRERNPNVSESLATLIHQLLAKKPEDRPQTAADVAKRLRAILDQLAAPVGAEPPVPMATSADVSASMPVVVHPVPMQPPIVVPMQIAAQPESEFADLGADDAGGATEAARAGDTPKPERKKSGGKGMLIAAGVAVLLTLIAGVVVVSQMGKKPEPEAKSPDAGTTRGEKGKSDAKGPNVPAGPLPATFKNSIGMEFVKVPKGTGWLGGGGGKEGETKVVIEQDFYLGKYEVTQGEWEAVTGLMPSVFNRGNVAVGDISDAELKRFPVENVSWEDCQAFIARLNQKDAETGWVYRLPKESEWEFACRGGPVDKPTSAFDFYFAKPTNVLLSGQANFNIENEKALKRTCRVGSYEPNSLGLYDMHGNLWEWCEDAVTGVDGASHRVSRGGCWTSDFALCRAAVRAALPPPSRGRDLGLRVARVPAAPVGKVSAADPNPDVPGTYTNALGMKFVPVRKGTGWLGGSGGTPGESKVVIDQDFYLGKYEVTQEEWEALMGLTPSSFKPGNEAVKDIGDAELKRFPVENVSWDACQACVKKLNEREKESGWVYRLPKEAEWEYACRGGPGEKPDSAFDFYFAKRSNTLLPYQANFKSGGELKRPCKVGSYEPNSIGLYDMHGNVAEWCVDIEKTAGGTTQRVNRGGCWNVDSVRCQAAFRSAHQPSIHRNNLGLRLVGLPSAPAGK